MSCSGTPNSTYYVARNLKTRGSTTFHNSKRASSEIYNEARVEAADEQGAAAAPAGPRDRPLMNSLFSRMGTSWSARPTDAPPPPGDGPRAPPPPPLDATTMPGKDDDVYRPRDRSPDSVLEDPSNWARDDGSASSEATPPPRALERAASAPAAASCGDLRGVLAPQQPKKKLRKSVSFHSTVSLVRSESLSDLPADEKHKIWYRSDDYSRFVHSELGRRREMGVTSTSLIMPTRVAHFEVEDDYAESDGDARMDDWNVGCASDSSYDSDEGAGDAPVRVVG